MAPVTEVVLLTLVSDKHYTAYGAVMESVKILAQQPGCLAVRASRLLEQPDKIHYFIDWDSVDSHFAFARNKDAYAPFRAVVNSFMGDYAPPYHVSLSPFPPAVFNQGGDEGVVMILKAWFPGGQELTAEETKAVSEAFATFGKSLRNREVEGFSGQVAQGWSLEDKILFKGEESRVFMFAAGWESWRTNLNFSQNHFKEMSAGVTNLRKLRTLDICSINTADNIAHMDNALKIEI
ncbi:hypothetical protein F5Y09DRAFT_321797 [Xylaria sp. FL1042]|nr:hypothetical protein F5Y09DRAFT_321797 [Xylaria sp. FL1042]